MAGCINCFTSSLSASFFCVCAHAFWVGQKKESPQFCAQFLVITKSTDGKVTLELYDKKF